MREQHQRLCESAKQQVLHRLRDAVSSGSVTTIQAALQQADDLHPQPLEQCDERTHATDALDAATTAEQQKQQQAIDRAVASAAEDNNNNTQQLQQQHEQALTDIHNNHKKLQSKQQKRWDRIHSELTDALHQQGDIKAELERALEESNNRQQLALKSIEQQQQQQQQRQQQLQRATDDATDMSSKLVEANATIDRLRGELQVVESSTATTTAEQQQQQRQQQQQLQDLSATNKRLAEKRDNALQ